MPGGQCPSDLNWFQAASGSQGGALKEQCIVGGFGVEARPGRCTRGSWSPTLKGASAARSSWPPSDTTELSTSTETPCGGRRPLS
ncbi:unnamed protein product [Arctogadus glacialis]